MESSFRIYLEGFLSYFVKKFNKNKVHLQYIGEKVKMRLRLNFTKPHSIGVYVVGGAGLEPATPCL